MTRRSYFNTIILFALLSALGQFSTNVYLPGLTEIAREFGRSKEEIELSVTVFLATFACGQLVYGPAADRYGRKIAIWCGTLLFVAGSLISGAAVDLSMLLIGRGLQGIGAGAGVIVARTLARDLYPPERLYRGLALINSLFAVVPAISPIIGAVILTHFGWRATFGLTAVLAVTLLIWLQLTVAEPVHKKLPSLNLSQFFDLIVEKLSDRVFLRYALGSGLAYGALFAFLTESPFLLITTRGLSQNLYALVLLIGVGCTICGSIAAFAVPFSRRESTFRTGIIACVPIALVIVATFAVNPASTVLLLLPVFGFMFVLGFLMPIAISTVLLRYHATTGTASSVLGFAHMACGTGATLLLIAYSPLGRMALPTTILSLSVLSTTSWLLLRTKKS